jgi:hypothetical protein
MDNEYRSRNGLFIKTIQGTKREDDRIIEISKGSFSHWLTLSEMGIAVAFKALNEEIQYPSQLGNKGWKLPIEFIKDCAKYYIENPDIDLDKLIDFLEKKHKIVQYQLGLGFVRQRIKT